MHERHLDKILFSALTVNLSINQTKMLEHIVRLELIYESVQQSGHVSLCLSAQSDYFSLPTQRYLKCFKTHGSLIQAANTLIAHDGCSG